MNSKLHVLFSMLIAYRHNIHILHWNVVGKGFDCVHGLLDSYLDKFNEFIDEIGEMILSLDGHPLSLQGCLDTLTRIDKEILILETNEDYECDDVYKSLDIMFKGLYEVYSSVSTEMNNECSGKLDEHKYWLRIESQYKNKRRMKD